MLKMHRKEPVQGGRLRAAIALLKRAPRRALAHASDSLRVLAFLVLRAASHLPRRWAYGVADAIGFLYASSPVGERARKSFAVAFPDRDARKLAREWITRPGRDYVGMHRLFVGRDNAADMEVDSRHEPALLREPGQSLIIALGHFSREANIALYKAGVIPKRVAATIAPLDRRSWRPRALRLRIQITAIMDGIVRARDGDVDVVPFDGPAALTRLVKHLRRPDTVVTISTDAVTEKGRERGHERPFAGHANVSFALGTARLARLSQRPILVCVPFLDDNGGFAIDWGEPIPAPARDDESADARITDAILDFFERAVGLRPGQYMFAIGDQRQWNDAAMAWVDATRRDRLSVDRCL
jgi:lauroyl/myristoyl acyltransferase